MSVLKEGNTIGLDDLININAPENYILPSPSYGQTQKPHEQVLSRKFTRARRNEIPND